MKKILLATLAIAFAVSANAVTVRRVLIDAPTLELIDSSENSPWDEWTRGTVHGRIRTDNLNLTTSEIIDQGFLSFKAADFTGGFSPRWKSLNMHDFDPLTAWGTLAAFPEYLLTATFSGPDNMHVLVTNGTEFSEYTGTVNMSVPDSASGIPGALLGVGALIVARASRARRFA